MADVLERGPARPLNEQSTAELVQRASEQISLLVRDESCEGRLQHPPAQSSRRRIVDEVTRRRGGQGAAAVDPVG